MAKLLYIEDNDDNVYMLTMRLELVGDFEVLVAENGETGCAKAIAELPDLILMDMDLPVVSGWEAAKRLKGDDRTRDIPIIALTSHAMAGSRQKALEVGCDEFAAKPLDFDFLVNAIRRLLAKKSGAG
jgi:two-component system, cell cycle response regulator DivK